MNLNTSYVKVQYVSVLGVFVSSVVFKYILC